MKVFYWKYFDAYINDVAHEKSHMLYKHVVSHKRIFAKLYFQGDAILHEIGLIVGFRGPIFAPVADFPRTGKKLYANVRRRAAKREAMPDTSKGRLIYKSAASGRSRNCTSRVVWQIRGCRAKRLIKSPQASNYFFSIPSTSVCTMSRAISSGSRSPSQGRPCEKFSTLLA